MAYQEGDTSPPHTNVHNDVRTQLDQLSTEFEIPVVLPPVVGLGDVGHVDHHNLFTTAINELSKHECEDGLEGLGGWAEITEVSGSPKRYAYNDGPGGVGGMDWVAFEWTQDGELTTDAGGLVDVLIISGGQDGEPGNLGRPGAAGGVNYGVKKLSGTSFDVEVGDRTINIKGTLSRLGDFMAGITPPGSAYGGGGGIPQYGYGAGAGGCVGGHSGNTGGAGLVSSITGPPSIEYGKGGSWGSSQSGATPGSGGDAISGGAVGQGSAGVVIVRVPAEQAAGVDPGSWVTRSNHFAVVENGVVTETYTEHHYGNGTVSPLPQTDLIPCDAQVTEGYAYENGEFVPPPAPEIPAAQQEILDKINELQQELRSYDE